MPFCLSQLSRSYADEGYYKTTNLYDLSYENTVKQNSIYANVKTYTANEYLAETTESIQLTFIGDTSVAGSYNIGPFINSGLTQETVLLNHDIGQLHAVEFQKHGYDEWLLSTFSCQIGNTVYEFQNSNRVWLNSYYLPNEVSYGDGFIPFVQTDTLAVSKLRLNVVKSYLVND